MGFFDKLKQGLTKTRQGFTQKIEQILGSGTIDEDMLDDLEAILIQADLGVNTTAKIMNNLRKAIKTNHITDGEQLQSLLQEQITLITGKETRGIKLMSPLTVIMVVGVNGVGKTTTIGKLGHYFRQNGLKVMLAAGDTFRAAAIEQLEIWGQRIGCEVIKHADGANPAAVAYDAVQAAQARKIDVLIIDTAGRLHTKSNLMEELKKIKRVVDRELPGAPQETLLVLDATTGQNALSQAKLFHEAVDLTGLVLTKLDGTAKGGVVVAIQSELSIPIKLIGVGEGIDDLRPFVPDEFIQALFAR